MKNVDLLIIDPQEDFCNPKTGSLYVKGANEDMKRLALFLSQIHKKLRQIHVTLDQHHYIDISHPSYWRNKKGENPKPFTEISHFDIKKEIWLPTNPGFKKIASRYTEILEQQKKYKLTIWPFHCIIGSPGANITPVLFESLKEWENEKKKPIEYIRKGENIHTEHYSALKPEVLDIYNPTNSSGRELINKLLETDIILLGGEAGSHCVLATSLDIILYLEIIQREDTIKKIVLLKDTISPVPGYEKKQDEFIKEISKKGVQVTTTKDFLS